MQASNMEVVSGHWSRDIRYTTCSYHGTGCQENSVIHRLSRVSPDVIQKNVMYTDLRGTYFKHVCFYKVQWSRPKTFWWKITFFFRLDLSPLPLRTGPHNSNFEADPPTFWNIVVVFFFCIWWLFLSGLYPSPFFCPLLLKKTMLSVLIFTSVNRAHDISLLLILWNVYMIW